MRAIVNYSLAAGQLTHSAHGVRATPRSCKRSGVAAALAVAAIAFPLDIEQAFATGPGDGEIRIGNTMPYSGPASAYGVIGKVVAAYFSTR